MVLSRDVLQSLRLTVFKTRIWLCCLKTNPLPKYIFAIILAIELTSQQGRNLVWLASDSDAKVSCTTNSNFMPSWQFRTRWHNRLQLIHGMTFCCSHVYRKVKTGADKFHYLVNLVVAGLFGRTGLQKLYRIWGDADAWVLPKYGFY